MLNKRRGKGAMTLDIARLERKKLKIERRAQKLVGTLMAISDLIVALRNEKAKEVTQTIAIETPKSGLMDAPKT